MKPFFNQTNRHENLLIVMALLVMITTIMGKLSKKERKLLDDHITIESDMDTSEMDDSNVLSFYAVTDGAIVPIEEVEDDVFAQKMIGDGYAMKPTSETVVAPVSGRLIQVAETKHAYYIETPNGIKVLIHVGLDTLLLDGKGFDVHVEKDMFVNEGDALVTFDKGLVEEHGYHTTIPVIVLEDQNRDVSFTLHTASDAKAGETKALDVTSA